MALLRAGAGCVVSTLWKVDDLATALLMDRFYAIWRDGRSIGSAMRFAQNWLRGVSDCDGRCLFTGKDVLDHFDRDILGLMRDDGTFRRLRRKVELLMLDYIDKPPFADPIYWAGFTVSGYDDYFKSS